MPLSAQIYANFWTVIELEKIYPFFITQRSVTVPKIDISKIDIYYIFVQNGIIPLKLAYAAYAMPLQIYTKISANWNSILEIILLS